jgi:hypothetical protein
MRAGCQVSMLQSRGTHQKTEKDVVFLLAPPDFVTRQQLILSQFRDAFPADEMSTALAMFAGLVSVFPTFQKNFSEKHHAAPMAWIFEKVFVANLQKELPAVPKKIPALARAFPFASADAAKFGASAETADRIVLGLFSNNQRVGIHFQQDVKEIIFAGKFETHAESKKQPCLSAAAFRRFEHDNIRENLFEFFAEVFPRIVQNDYFS